MLSNEASDYVHRRLDLSPLPAARQQQQQAETTDEGTCTILPALLAVGFAKLLNGDELCEESVLPKIKQCTSPVEEYVDLISTTLPTFIANVENYKQTFISNTDTFQELCKRIWKFQSCIDPLKLFCPEHKTVNFIYTTYGYLCDEGYSDFLHNVECFLFVESESDARECLQNVSTQTVTFHKGTISRSSTEQACKLVHDFLNCIKIPGSACLSIGTSDCIKFKKLILESCDCCS
ncbi:1-aminomutase,Glutamate-1-semialdehyde 2 [Trichinella pseudospiralis]